MNPKAGHLRSFLDYYWEISGQMACLKTLFFLQGMYPPPPRCAPIQRYPHHNVSDWKFLKATTSTGFILNCFCPCYHFLITPTFESEYSILMELNEPQSESKTRACLCQTWYPCLHNVLAFTTRRCK